MQAFLNEQFAAPTSTFPAPGTNDDMSVVQNRFFANTLNGQDQLRQRVAWALGQIMVTSAVKINNPSAMVLWQNMLQNDAFGNFSTLLTDVTLSPVMGNYLDMVNNDKPDPMASTPTKTLPAKFCSCSASDWNNSIRTAHLNWIVRAIHPNVRPGRDHRLRACVYGMDLSH